MLTQPKTAPQRERLGFNLSKLWLLLPRSLQAHTPKAACTFCLWSPERFLTPRRLPAQGCMFTPQHQGSKTSPGHFSWGLQRRSICCGNCNFYSRWYKPQKKHSLLHITWLGRSREMFPRKDTSSFPIPLWAVLRELVPRREQVMLCTLPLLYHWLTQEHQRCWSVKQDTYFCAPRGKQQRLISLKMLYSI